jgi:nuclease-like protein
MRDLDFLLRNNGMAGKSPLKAKPLHNPGDSADEEIDRHINDRFLDVLLFATGFCLLALFEWVGYLAHIPRQPVALSCAALVAVVLAAWRFADTRKQIKQLKLGRDGERCVGQFLERLRASGAQVFHDIPGDGFNLDHVVISPQGIYAVETKTFSKPWPKAKVTVEGTTLLVAGRVPDRNPMEQAATAARWLEDRLEESTGKRFTVRGVVVFPGWFVEQRLPRGPVWVLEPKMLPGFIEQEPKSVAPTDVALSSFHLSRYVRGEVEKAA